MGHRGTFALVAAALVIATSACSADSAADPDASASQAPTAIDPALLDCGEPEDGDPVLQLAAADLTAATWTIPEGFVETFAYSEDRPVEHVESFRALEPAEDPVPLNVLTVVVYSELDWGDQIDECGRVPVDVVESRLAGYRETTGAEPLTELELGEVAGLPAVEQDVRLEQYSYRGYWLFGRTQLMHLYCQWTADAEKDRIVKACDDLVASVEVPGA